MNGEGLGPQATSLLREAHRDVPSHSRRTEMWQGVEAGVVGTAAAAGTFKALSGLTKVLLGVVIGGALVAGLTATLLPPKLNDDLSMIDHPSRPVMVVREVLLAPAVTLGTGTTTDTDLELGNDENVDSLVGSAGVDGVRTNPSNHGSAGGVGSGHHTTVNANGAGGSTNLNRSGNPNASGNVNAAPNAHEDPLVREARLVAEARGALLRGDPSQALNILKVARSTPNPGMEPEELALQARALRELGSKAEADAVEKDLARRFPENSLSR